jgi:YspA, cpYpsA-related SLOG family
VTARILVTGSRSWPSSQLLADALMDAWHDATQLGHQDVVIVHGGADGADTLARLWAEGHGLEHQQHDADWAGPCADTCPPGHRRKRARGGDYCPLAGHRRNQHMVDLGADLCLAFHHNSSTGTADAMRRAAAAGIPVRRIAL